jgi:hypothetical protein
MAVSSRASRPWHRLVAALAGLLTAFAIGALGQPPEEEEDPKGGVKKKVVVEDDPAAKGKGTDVGPGTPPDVRLDELVRGAEEAKHPALKELFLNHAVPFDRLNAKGTVTRIKPIPISRAERLPPVFGAQELLRNGQFGEAQAVNAGEVKRIEYFEEVTLAEGNKLLELKPYGTKGGAETWTAVDQLRRPSA